MTFTTEHVETEHGHHGLVCGFACRSRDVRVERHLALRSTCTTDCRRNGESCIGTGIRSIPTPLVLGPKHRPVDFCSQTSTPSNLCAMTSVMLSTAFRIPSTTIAPLPCVDDVVIRTVDRWQVTSGLFYLSRSRSERQLSRSRSVTRAQQRENSKHTVWSEVRLQLLELGFTTCSLTLRKSQQKPVIFLKNWCWFLCVFHFLIS